MKELSDQSHDCGMRQESHDIVAVVISLRGAAQPADVTVLAPTPSFQADYSGASSEAESEASREEKRGEKKVQRWRKGLSKAGPPRSAGV